jgi:fructose-1,6-bisphosphatase/inositol monophosphatase family enzyme
VIEKVELLMREVAAESVLPRFQTLRADEIHEKGPGDLVTVADREAERLLSRRLVDLLPGSVVIGEEAVFADPSLMSHIADEGFIWLVDPVDGTSNFAAGREPFAMMVALLQEGHTTAAWILDPLHGVAATAELGGGAFLDGERIATPTVPRAASELRGVALVRYLPRQTREEIASASAMMGEVIPGRNCAGYEYPAIARDEQQFALFGRMLAWDHAAGVLLVEEAGGVARHLDGEPYDPTSPRFGVLVAQNRQIWHTVRTTLLAHLDAG